MQPIKQQGLFWSSSHSEGDEFCDDSDVMMIIESNSSSFSISPSEQTQTPILINRSPNHSPDHSPKKNKIQNFTINFSQFAEPQKTKDNFAERKITTFFESDNLAKIKLLLKKFPKGGDTHHHLTGGLEPEKYLEFAIKSDLYCHASNFVFFEKPEMMDCDIKSAKEIRDCEYLRTAFCQKATTRGRPSITTEEFFKTFAIVESIEKFMPLSGLLEPVIKDAIEHNILYLEVSKGFEFNKNLMPKFHEFKTNFPERDQFGVVIPFEILDKKLELLKNSQAFQKKKNEYIGYINEADNTPAIFKEQKFGDSLFSIENPIVVRLNVDINRELSLPEFFLDLVMAFEIIQSEIGSEKSRVLGIVLSGREHYTQALLNRKAQYKMIDYLHSKYPKAKISVHAGELKVSETVSHEDMERSIWDAVEFAKPDRIGHAVCLFDQKNHENLIKWINEKNICVESCLSSNMKLLRVQEEHPLPLFLEKLKAVTVNTDDPGVLGIKLSDEFQKVLDLKTSYTNMKKLARNQLTYSFLPNDDREIEISHKTRLQERLEKQLNDFEEFALSEIAPKASRKLSLGAEAQMLFQIDYNPLPSPFLHNNGHLK